MQYLWIYTRTILIKSSAVFFPYYMKSILARKIEKNRGDQGKSRTQYPIPTKTVEHEKLMTVPEK